MRSRKRAAGAALAVVTVLLAGLLAGCSGGDVDPGGTSNASSDGSGTEAGDGSGPTPSTGPPLEPPLEPTAEPADGELVSLASGVSFRLTDDADWGVLGAGSRNVTADAAVDGVAELVLLDVGEFPSLTDDRDRSAQANLDALLSRGEDRYPTLRRTQDREVGGVVGFVLQSETDEARFYLFGADHDGTSYTFGFEVPVELALDDWVEPILASITWG